MKAYSQLGAMRCALEVYWAFLQDAKETREWTKAHGKCKVPANCLSGEWSALCGHARQVVAEAFEAGA